MINAECEKCIHGKKTTGRCVRLASGTMIIEDADGESITCTARVIREIRMTDDGMYCSSFDEKAS